MNVKFNIVLIVIWLIIDNIWKPILKFQGCAILCNYWNVSVLGIFHIVYPSLVETWYNLKHFYRELSKSTILSKDFTKLKKYSPKCKTLVTICMFTKIPSAGFWIVRYDTSLLLTIYFHIWFKTCKSKFINFYCYRNLLNIRYIDTCRTRI